ncbi:MAG: alginate export family protein [Pseudomonadota bacterium]
MRHTISAFAFLVALTAATPAIAGPLDPVEIAEGVELDPILDVRLRYETADQDAVFADNAESITIRTRAGAKISTNGFSLLAEAEGTVALENDFNDTIPQNGIEPFPVIADPNSFQLNRLQVGYNADGFGVTLGRQRIILDDARFVGNVGWRQNEQTFDAVRGTAKFGPVKLDATYAIQQNTIFGSRSPNDNFDGDFIFLNAGADFGVVKGAVYHYNIDYDRRIGASSASTGIYATASVPAGPLKLNGRLEFATQSDTGANPVDYSADFFKAEAGAAIAGFGLKLGYEELGSDDGIQAFQTPLATAHKFNGFADLFLVTPATGLQDRYVTLSKSFKVPALPGLRAFVTYHDFNSDFGSIDYGTEWDAVVTFKVGPVGLLAKYGDYNANGFGVDTQRFTLQAGISF